MEQCVQSPAWLEPLNKWIKVLLGWTNGLSGPGFCFWWLQNRQCRKNVLVQGLSVVCSCISPLQQVYICFTHQLPDFVNSVTSTPSAVSFPHREVEPFERLLSRQLLQFIGIFIGLCLCPVSPQDVLHKMQTPQLQTAPSWSFKQQQNDALCLTGSGSLTFSHCSWCSPGVSTLFSPLTQGQYSNHWPKDLFK